jgi:hypothetical protein
MHKLPDSTEKQGMQFKVSINYNSGLNYYGRTDSLKSTGVFPMAEVWFTPKVYINAAPVFIHNNVEAMAYAGSVASIGYLNITEKWISNLYLLKPFYKESSELVQSALKAQTGASFTALSKGINISFGGDIKYSDQIDFGALVGIDHIFRFENKDKSVLVIDPTFTANAGTQNFTTSYKKKTGRLLFAREEEVTETNKKFTLLSLEASVPVIYTKGKMQFIATPSYVMPKNLMQVPNKPELSEMGSNMFYTTLAVKYTF